MRNGSGKKISVNIGGSGGCGLRRWKWEKWIYIVHGYKSWESVYDLEVQCKFGWDCEKWDKESA